MESNKIFALVLSSDAIKDIDTAFDYYEKASEGLGYEFIREIDFYFHRIQKLPTSSSIQYENVRVKPLEIFPFTIHYNIIEDKVIILRIFNTRQQPFWEV